MLSSNSKRLWLVRKGETRANNGCIGKTRRVEYLSNEGTKLDSFGVENSKKMFANL